MRAALLCLLILVIATPVCAQHLGARQQWQPQTESDSRLQQQVAVEILGRAATPALALLSEKTGVSLAVAPEDLSTVGERKFTLISKDVSLKAILVNLPEALQECHWDVDASGKEPVYLLHRNSGVDYDKLREAVATELKAQQEERDRRASAARLEATVQAAKLSPAEVDALRDTDPLLALALKDKASRAALDAFLALPSEGRRQFEDTGAFRLEAKDASPAIRAAVEAAVGSFFTEMVDYVKQHPETLSGDLDNKPADFEAEMRAAWAQVKEELAAATFTFRDGRAEMGGGVVLSVQGAGPGEQEFVVVPPRYPNANSASPLLPLLIVSGAASPAAAQTTLMDWARKGQEAGADEAEGGSGEARQPATPFPMPGEGPVVLTEFQQSVAEKTGLTIISDYFTRDFVLPTKTAPAPRPLWQVLDLLGRSTPAGFQWRKAGVCLVFHRTLWPVWAAREVPESLLLSYREKLATQGHLTLAEACALYAQLSGPPPYRERAVELPDDLKQALGGLSPDDWWAPVLYTALSPEQAKALRGSKGVALANLRPAARKEVLDLLTLLHRRGVTPDQLASATCRLEEHKGQEEGRPFTQYDFQLLPQSGANALRTATLRLYEVATPISRPGL
jgi:hypothetical protein